MEIIRFLGSPPEFNIISCVSRGWARLLDCSDSETWCWIASEFKLSLHSLGQKRSLRSTSNYKKVFMKAYKKASQEIREKHEILLLLAKSFFGETTRDCPCKLAAIIHSVFPDLHHFDVNWTSSVVEANTLVTMCCRGAGRPKCLKLLLEAYSANIELGDMGGFTPLILSAYHGNLACTVYCVKRGANIFAVGRERSGIHLIAEHWASIRGHSNVREYLSIIRTKLQKKIFDFSLSKVSLPSAISPAHTPTSSPVSQHQGMNTGRDCVAWDDNSDDASGSSLSQCKTVLDSSPSSPDSQQCRAAHDISATSPSQLSASHSPYSTTVFKTYLLDGSEMHCPPLSSSTLSVLVVTPSAPQQAACYCVCTRGHIGSMIQCDSADCPIQWFHYCCVGLTEDVADDDYWLCPNCDSEDPLGRFPEPRLTLYSSFLKQPLLPLTIHSIAGLQKSNSECKIKQKRRKYQCVTPMRLLVAETVAVAETVIRADTVITAETVSAAETVVVSAI